MRLQIYCFVLCFVFVRTEELDNSTTIATPINATGITAVELSTDIPLSEDGTNSTSVQESSSECPSVVKLSVEEERPHRKTLYFLSGRWIIRSIGPPTNICVDISSSVDDPSCSKPLLCNASFWITGKLKLPELCPHHNYSLTVILTCEDEEIGKSINYATKPGEPSAPTEVKLSSGNATALTVCWKPPAHPRGPIDGYRCTYSPGKMQSRVVDVAPSNACHTVTSLRPWTNYTIQIVAFNNFTKDVRIFGPALTINFTTPESEPSPPENLRFTDPSSSTLRAAWEPPSTPNGKIVNYTVRWWLSDGKPEFHNTTKTRYILKNLRSFRNYSVSVRAWTSVGSSHWTEAVTTNTDVGKPSAPTNVSLPETNSTAILVRWGEPEEKNGPIDGYFVEYGTKALMVKKKITNALQFRTEKLSPWTVYVFKISAFNTNMKGETVESDVVRKERKTAEGAPGVVDAIWVESVTNVTVTLSWLPPAKRNGVIIGYVLRYARSGDIWKEVETVNISYTFRNLEPYVYYDMQVAARTSAATGNYSDIEQIQTDVGVPGPPKELEMLEKSDAHMEIFWEEPVVQAGPIDGYCVAFWETDTMEIISHETCENKTHLKMVKLNPWTNYSVSVKAFNVNRKNETLVGPAAVLTNRTGIRAPPAPTISSVTVLSSTSVWLEWMNEGIFPGPTAFSIQVWKERSRCPNESEPYSRISNRTVAAKSWKVLSATVSGLAPFTQYFFIIAAMNAAGRAFSGRSPFVRTEPDVPSEPQNFFVDCLKSSTSVFLSWDSPEISNGRISEYRISYKSDRDQTKQVERIIMKYDSECYKANLKKVLYGFRPEVNYEFSLCAKTENTEQYGPETYFENCILPAGVPPIPDNSSSLEVEDFSQQEVTLVMSSTIFSSEMGQIIYYSLIVASQSVIGQPCKGSVSDAKPLPVWSEFWNQDSDIYQATPENWNPFNSDVYDPLNCHESSEAGEDILKCVVGWEKNCSAEKRLYCNGPLKPGKVYGMKLRGFTKGGFSETYPVFVTTAPVGSNFAVALSVGLLVCLVSLVLLALYIHMRKNNKEFSFGKLMVLFHKSMEQNSEPNVVLSSNGVPVEKIQRRPFDFPSFLVHVVEMMSDSGLRFSMEFEDLKNSSPKHPASMAQMEENLAKNRWTNILPFDHSRVKLLPVDDEPASDYINSSYIPGYYSHREYIASQGPLPGTVDDFWRMIWEQKVMMVVMLTQCVERGKTKCEQYWPKSTAEHAFYGDLMVQMTSESSCSTYTVRTFNLKLGSRQRVVRQMHYIRWPDFGCPESSEELISFVISVRSHLSPKHSGPILVHCSAGVGRTGTFIAVDRLMQHVQYNNCIDVYNTVLEMREHRTNMVQTEDQYIYIHKCLRNVILEKIKNRDESDNNGSAVYPVAEF